ncbi:MAG: antibiotic biosynthesis monooxygenase [Tessaracoccus sp.]|uniref:putative quinol monooxygenase n=1 Tax=Tessaracoccus sp. TaxID=1971211 RepID=UPI001EB83B9B|nr:antibiotic biosynthesis monooxygenase family protein [Tessaracoccus sp.]MBK7820218.1 antibiotic biosynthesis monooxygenase [Tessaracoccus sp.]
MGAVNLIASIPARAETVDEVRALLVEYGTHVLAMPGAERFEVYVDREDPVIVVVVERYADDQAFAEHLADPANAVLNDALATLTDGGSSLRFLAPAGQSDYLP